MFKIVDHFGHFRTIGGAFAPLASPAPWLYRPVFSNSDAKQQNLDEVTKQNFLPSESDVIGSDIVVVPVFMAASRSA